MSGMFERITKGLRPARTDAPAAGDYEAGEAHVDGADLAEGECRWSASLGRALTVSKPKPADFEYTRPLCAWLPAASSAWAAHAA